MVYVFLANGFEETEALVTVDILRRAGYEVLTVGVGSEFIEGSHGITVKADITEDKITPDDTLTAVVLPGGMPGTLGLGESRKVAEFLRFADQKKRVIGAICAAPSVLGEQGYLGGKVATCFPGFEEKLIGATVEKAPCCISDNIVTAAGAGAVFEFAFALVDAIAWQEEKVPFGDFSISEKLEETMQCAR
ncbi:MAG: DJ-1/PfpI family protein [Clostridia bacterium]|nr:DJ-1/PfpI family protein [Clostridia bacterium]